MAENLIYKNRKYMFQFPENVSSEKQKEYMDIVNKKFDSDDFVVIDPKIKVYPKHDSYTESKIDEPKKEEKKEESKIEETKKEEPKVEVKKTEEQKKETKIEKIDTPTSVESTKKDSEHPLIQKSENDSE